MEGGVRVNSPRMIRPHRYLYVLVLSVLVAAFMIVNVGYSQPGKKVTREIKFYKMTGRLQVFSLEAKQAQINDLTWDLSDTFRTKEISPEWKKGTVEFTERQIWVYYYVSLSTVTEESVGTKKTDKKTMKMITDPEEVRKIHEMGGKIYKIECAPE